MIDIEKREQKEQEKAKTRQRMQVKVDPNNYEFIPAQKETDYYDNDVNQRVGIYVRVSEMITKCGIIGEIALTFLAFFPNS